MLKKKKPLEQNIQELWDTNYKMDKSMNNQWKWGEGRRKEE